MPGSPAGPQRARIQAQTRKKPLKQIFSNLTRAFDRIEGGVASSALALMALLPLVEILLRRFDRGVPGAGPLVQHLTLWVGFLGAALAASEGKLLALATGTFLPEGRWRHAANIFSGMVGAAVSVLLCLATLEFLGVEREFETTVSAGAPMWVALVALPAILGFVAWRLAGALGRWRWAVGGAGAGAGLWLNRLLAGPGEVPLVDRPMPVWVAMLAMPVAFGLIALRLVWRSSPRWWGRLIAAAGPAVGLGLGLWLILAEEPPELPAWPGIAVIFLATALGGPIFTTLGGAAVLLFVSDMVPIAAVPVETYRLSVSATLPAIPLFTLTGFLIAEGKASQRLIGVFRALFGWFPGGTAVVAAVVCAFFTVFTGGSGVTILALGGLLFAALTADRYREQFSIGLLTASGSLGLLLPPALPLILYGIVARVSIRDLFLGGLVPGVLLVGLIAAWGMREGLVTRVERVPFEWRSLGRAVWEGKWELFLPLFLLVAIFSGWATLVEASALSAVYAFFIQCVLRREITLTADLPRVVRQCVVLIGGVLIILGVAMGLTSYLVDAQVPAEILGWVQGHIESRVVFLLTLNLFLLVVGCLMDIFSATVVVVPLIIPLGEAFGIDPIHLGIIFIANLELGYLTPPVGLNLFLASYRFERPLLKIYRAAVPMLIILGIGVLLITYVPWLTTGILSLTADFLPAAK